LRRLFGGSPPAGDLTQPAPRQAAVAPPPTPEPRVEVKPEAEAESSGETQGNEPGSSPAANAAGGQERSNADQASAPPKEPPAQGEVESIFGIDFGTTYTSIGVITGGHLKVLKDETGATMFPSVVCIPSPGQFLVGWEARKQSPMHPTTTFHSPKRLIGRRFDDRKIEPVIASMAVPLRAGPNGQVIADIHGSPLAMPQVCAELFRHAARVGEQETGEKVRRVVISAPVEYRTERKAIQRAAELAQLEIVSIVDEPIAAAIGYGLNRHAGLVAVYDFGGGTFDCTLLEVEGGRFRILAKTGDAWLGGDDFDLALAEHAARGFWRQFKIDLHNRRVEWQRLQDACEGAKRALSDKEAVELRVPELARLQSGPADLRVRLDHKLLDQLCMPLVDRSIESLAACLQKAGAQAADVGHIAMTGGVSRMPLVRRRVEQYFGREVSLAVDPQHAVVVGDAIYAHYLVTQAKVARAS
jgi:molecular chaperone DnaK